VLFASSERGLQDALDRFSAACDHTGMKIITKMTEYYVSPETQLNQLSLHVSGNKLQQVEKFKFLVVVFTSDGNDARRLIHGLVKQTQFYVSFIALSSQNRNSQTP